MVMAQIEINALQNFNGSYFMCLLMLIQMNLSAFLRQKDNKQMDMNNYSPESNIDRKTPTETIKKMRVTNSRDNFKMQCTMGQSTKSEVPFTFF